MTATESPEELSEAFTAAIEEDGERLVEALELLEQMPQVRLLPNSVFDRARPPGSVAQQRGVIVKLRCCKKPFDQKCNEKDANDPTSCPTHVEAALLLRAKVLKQHGSAQCLAKANEATAAEAAAGSSSAAPTERTVAALMAQQLAIQRAHRELKRAQIHLEETAEAECRASLAREAASTALEEVPSPCLPARPIASLLVRLPARPPACTLIVGVLCGRPKFSWISFNQSPTRRHGRQRTAHLTMISTLHTPYQLG
jgi:hypothetical protein